MMENKMKSKSWPMVRRNTAVIDEKIKRELASCLCHLRQKDSQKTCFVFSFDSSVLVLFSLHLKWLHVFHLCPVVSTLLSLLFVSRHLWVFSLIFFKCFLIFSAVVFLFVRLILNFGLALPGFVSSLDWILGFYPLPAIQPLSFCLPQIRQYRTIVLSTTVVYICVQVG